MVLYVKSAKKDNRTAEQGFIRVKGVCCFIFFENCYKKILQNWNVFPPFKEPIKKFFENIIKRLVWVNSIQLLK